MGKGCKQKFLCIAVVFLATLFVAAPAMAASILSLVNNGPNKISDDDREYLIDRYSPILGGPPGDLTVYPTYNRTNGVYFGNDAFGNPLIDTNNDFVPDAVGIQGNIDVGDSLRGTLNFNTFNSVSANVGGTTGNNELTAVFQVAVAGKTPIPGVGAGFAYAPDPFFESDASGGQFGTVIGISAVTGKPVYLPGTATDIVPGIGAVAALFEGDALSGTLNFTADYDDPAPSIAPPADPLSQGGTGVTTPGIVDDGTGGKVDAFGTFDRNTAPTTPPSSADVSVAGANLSEEAMIATSIDGVYRMSVGYTGAQIPHPDPILAALGLTITTAGAGEGGTGSGFDNTVAAFALTSGSGGGLANFGLSVLYKDPVWDAFVKINKVTPSPFGGTVDFVLGQLVSGVFDLDTPFELSSDSNVSFNATVVPEPASIALMGVGLLGLCAFIRRRKKLN